MDNFDTKIYRNIIQKQGNHQLITFLFNWEIV